MSSYSYNKSINLEELKELLEFNPEEDLENKIFVEQILKHLKPRNEYIIRMRYGLNEDGISYSQEEVARKMNLSRPRVGQIEKNAITECKKVVKSLHKRSVFESYYKQR